MGKQRDAGRVARPHFLLLLALLMLTGEAFGLAAQFDRNLAGFIVAALVPLDPQFGKKG